MIRRLKLTLFVAFVLIDLVLVVLLVQYMRANTQDVDDEPASTASPSATPEAKVTGDVRLAMDRASGAIVRSMRGSCTGTGKPKLELSIDDGKTFGEVALPLLEKPDPGEPASSARAVRTILGVTVRSDDKVSIVAGDDQCDPQLYETDDAGETWTKADKYSGWYVDAAGDGVVSPREATEPGCDVVALTPFNGLSANVMCSGGRIRSTVDGGLTWFMQGAFEEELQAATFADATESHAVASSENCTRSFLSQDAGLTWKPRGCVGLARVRSMAGDGSTLIATDGDELRVSTNGGKKWKAP